MELLKGLASAREFLLDLLDGRCPHERFRMLVRRGQKLHDGLLQFFDVGERSAAHAFAGQFSKPSLDEIEPTGTGRDKVREKAMLWPLLQLAFTSRLVVACAAYGSGPRESLFA